MVLLLAGCLSTGSEPSSTSSLGEAWHVVEVVDGDTVVVERDSSTATVRLAGINAPERDECGAEEAAMLLRSLEGDAVRLEMTGRDQFDRVLAHLHSERAHLNHQLVAAGLALASTPSEDDPYGATLLEAEEQAYLEGRGLWATDACGSGEEPPSVQIDSQRSMPDPPGPDGEVLDSEVIVISNLSESPVDLSGWLLRDESSLHRFRFGAGTTLHPGGSTVVSSGDPGWDPGRSPVWNNDGDLALLQDPTGTVVSRWRY